MIRAIYFAQWRHMAGSLEVMSNHLDQCRAGIATEKPTPTVRAAAAILEEIAPQLREASKAMLILRELATQPDFITEEMLTAILASDLEAAFAAVDAAREEVASG
jgi:hypothetical protein